MIPEKLHRHSYSRTRGALAVLVTTVIFAALVFSSGTVSSQQSDPQRRDLERVFNRHERLSLDPGQITRQVKQTRSLILTTTRGTFEMTLEPHEIRAPGYVAEAWSDKGVRVLERTPVRTYKGTVKGLPEAQARMSIDEQTVEGIIITSDELFFLEPSKRFSASATKTDFVFYGASDLRESAGECGTLAEIVGKQSAKVSNQTSAKGPQPEALFGPQQQIAVALEADFEYYANRFGSSLAAVESQILMIMFAVDGIYSNDVGLRYSFAPTNLRVWTTDTDPYTTSDASDLLKQFQTAYNTSPPPQAANRDIAHLFTGRDLNGSTIGIAYRPGLNCASLNSAYGLSQHLTTGNLNFAGLTAHEIGHNLNAAHVDSDQGADCTSSIMNPNLSASQNFCQFSKDEITSHAIAMSDCLTALGPECTSIPPSSPTIPAAGGSVSVAVTASGSCNWAVAEGAGWLTVTSGATGTGNGTVVLSASGNSCGPRTALVSIGGQTHTVSQGGDPGYLTDLATATPISPGQTITGELSTPDCATGIVDPGDSPPTIRQQAFMDRYKFNGMAGQKIRIEMNSTIPATSGGLDTYLYLYGPDGNQVPNGENDDLWLPPGGNLTNSRIPCTNISTGPCAVEFLTLPQTGTYIIIATSFLSGDTGEYTLTFTSEPVLLTAQVADGVGTGAALNSVTFARTSNASNTAFSIVDNANFSADKTTRLILFTSDLGLAQQVLPDPSLVSVRAGGVELVVEHVGPFTFPGLNGSYVVVALKRRDGQAMPTGSLVFTVTRGVDPSNGAPLISNQTTLTIAP